MDSEEFLLGVVHTTLYDSGIVVACTQANTAPSVTSTVDFENSMLMVSNSSSWLIDVAL